MSERKVQKTANMRKLVHALELGVLEPGSIAALLGVSYATARNYLEELVQAGAARRDPEKRSRVRLHPDPGIVRDYLDTLAGREITRHISLRRSPSRHCMDTGKSYLHVLADDVRFPLVLQHEPARRDPLVVALFGRDVVHRLARDH